MGHVGEQHVRVLLAQGAPSVTVGCATPLTRHRRPAADADAPGRDVRRRVAARLPGAASTGRASPSGTSPSSTAPARRSRSTAASTTATLVLRSQGGGVSVVNGLSLDTYLRGVVPSESPSHWPLAALEAQAVAARSYAVAQLKPSSWYDLVPTTRRPGLRRRRGRDGRAPTTPCTRRSARS